MATTKEFKEYALEQLNTLNNIICRPMMGEYLLYYNETLFGGIYDNRVLIKITENNQKYNLEETIPYKSAKPMYLIDIDNKDLIKEIILVTCEALKKKGKKKWKKKNVHIVVGKNL